MKAKCILLITLLLCSFGIKAQNAADIFRKSVEAIDFESMEMTATLKITDSKGSERVRQISSANRKFGDANKMIMQFIAPPDIKGTAILIYYYEEKSDDMWIFMSALRKTRRVISTEKGKSFMGSEFSNADMSKPNLTDFNYKLLGNEIVEGKKCWIIEATCKNESLKEENGFSRKISFIDEETTLCRKVEFYDSENKIFKSELLNQFKKQPNGKYFAFSIEMKNIKNGRSSSLMVDKFQLGSNLQESRFSPAVLEK